MICSMILLIVPYGIEMFRSENDNHMVDILLIVPYGIEM